MDLQKLGKERDELRAMVEDRGRKVLHVSRAREMLEADLALCQEKLNTAHVGVGRSLNIKMHLCINKKQKQFHEKH